MKASTLFIVLLGLLSISSCQKKANDGIQSDTTKNETHQAMLSTTIDPSNSSNPYDYAGQDHNDGVIFYFENYYNPENPDSYDISYMLENFYDFSNQFAQDNEDFIIANNEAIWAETTEYATQLQTVFSEHPVLESLNNSIFSIIRSNISLQHKIDSIKSLEATVRESSTITDHEKYAFYHAASVARYSAVLWTSTEEGGLGGGDNPVVQDIAARATTDKIILSDFVGLWTVGLLTGWWSGPGPALIAAVHGSVHTALLS